MIKTHAIIVSSLVLASCAMTRGQVFTADRDTSFNALPQERLDQISIGWFAHGGAMGVSTITRISPSDWVPRDSVVIRKSKNEILVCYSIVHRSGKPQGEPPTAVKLTFVVPGIQRDDTRAVVVSATCGNSPSGA